MFESLEKRRKNTLWKAFGITVTLFAAGIWLIVYWRDQREKNAAEASHERYQAEMKHREEPQRVRLPGMSLVMPAAASQTGDYLEGKAVTREPYMVQLTWHSGDPLHDDDTAVLAKRDARTVLDTDVHFVTDAATTLGGAPAHEYRYRGATHDVFLTYGACGGRRIVLAVSGAIHSEDNAVVAHTFECKPTSFEVTRRDVVVDATAGWKRIDPDDRPLALSGPGGVRLRTFHFDRLAVEGSLADFVAHFAPSLDLAIPDKSTTRNEKLLYMGRSTTDRAPAALVTFRCPDDSVAMIAITGGASLTPGIELADSGRCLPAGDPMPTY